MRMASTITFKVDERVKDESKKLFSDLGLDMSTALNMFLRQCIAEQGIPFKAKRNQLDPLTIKTLEEVENGIGMHGPFSTYDEMMEDIMDAEA